MYNLNTTVHNKYLCDNAENVNDLIDNSILSTSIVMLTKTHLDEDVNIAEIDTTAGYRELIRPTTKQRANGKLADCGGVGERIDIGGGF